MMYMLICFINITGCASGIVYIARCIYIDYGLWELNINRRVLNILLAGCFLGLYNNLANMIVRPQLHEWQYRLVTVCVWSLVFLIVPKMVREEKAKKIENGY